jgi:hypothetical protein
VVVLTPLPAALLKEASYSSAAGVLDITALIYNLELLELNNGGNIGVNGTLRKEGPL